MGNILAFIKISLIYFEQLLDNYPPNYPPNYSPNYPPNYPAGTLTFCRLRALELDCSLWPGEMVVITSTLATSPDTRAGNFIGLDRIINSPTFVITNNRSGFSK